MERLINAVKRFQENIVPKKAELLSKLAHGQEPHTLFITCSDSRIDPGLMLSAEPGDIFVLRNAGNLVPPHDGQSADGAEATIEYAVAALEVKHIVVCGHDGCGAMGGLLNRDALSNLPSVAQWLRHAEATHRKIKQNYSELEGPELLHKTVRENVISQLTHLQTHPWVAAHIESSKLRLHGWVYNHSTGDVEEYDWIRHTFRPLGEDGNLLSVVDTHQGRV